ncbi:PREDICTED: uncharacterized protein LOC105147736 isoform X2 [Acromyrmex echinatior]|uniref:uncharacterized protein LOC105147736 isoform X2 n=1 Tax=Acromyrmex echinatior TaxID=103372 RepID=UPI000580DCD1|nr:PREDICTED: uncharacterized protein LOC105147736 isoform X2 [Acromyrmex echinatior]
MWSVGRRETRAMTARRNAPFAQRFLPVALYIEIGEKPFDPFHEENNAQLAIAAHRVADAPSVRADAPFRLLSHCEKLLLGKCDINCTFWIRYKSVNHAMKRQSRAEKLRVTWPCFLTPKWNEYRPELCREKRRRKAIIGDSFQNYILARALGLEIVERVDWPSNWEF